MLTVLGGLAEFERALILSRTGEGRTGNGAGGEVWEEAEANEASGGGVAGEERGWGGSGDIGRSFNVSHSTISRL
jgi:DNA invertase Pin-like site-specific DNA recombinase